LLRNGLPWPVGELTPLGKRGGAGEFEIVPACKTAFLIEVIVDGGVDGGEADSGSAQIDDNDFGPEQTI